MFQVSQNTQMKIPHRSKFLSQSTVQDVALWIYELASLNNFGNAADYAETFRQNEINGMELIGLKNEDLRDKLKITKLGHRLRITKAVGLVLTEEKSGLHNMMKHNSNRYPNLLERPQMSAPASNQGSQFSNWEAAPDGRECYRATGGHLRYPAWRSSRGLSDFDERKRQPQNIWQSRGHSVGRLGAKAVKNQRGRSAEKHQERKSSRSLRRSSLSSFTMENSGDSESREDMQSVSSTTSTKCQEEKKSTFVLAPMTFLQDGKEFVIEEMQKSRKSEIAPKPEHKQKDYEPLTSSSDEDDSSSLPKASSISSCSRRGNICQESKERCNGTKELLKHSRHFRYPHVQSDEDAFAKSLENGPQLKKKEPKAPLLSPEVIRCASIQSDKSE